MAETPFSLVCTISRSNASDIQAMRDSLVSETESESSEDNTFSFRLNEANAKDLRAMWNTRIRGLIAADEILQAIESAGSSTKDNSKEA
ncbi:MAG TPA: hypothetical protein D7H90_01440 [Candidatus Poseidoniales archaeon]|nr:hypothetical protein [Euryarchaeota archaeon]DAC19816.1 MAG TPA: hypothetical protein D7H90_01440 [Candidatus Poseidoniales archaeon]HII56191.1 hypothetical protein [Candidatus Poseidoniaceae archaeon]